MGNDFEKRNGALASATTETVVDILRSRDGISLEKSRKRNAKKAKKESPEWMAAYSARYILEDLNNEEGMESLAELTGLPLGVISAAFKNFFPENDELSQPTEED